MKCPKCNETFFTNQNYKKHLKRKIPCSKMELSISHEYNADEFKCDVCDTVFDNKFNLERHKTLSKFCENVSKIKSTIINNTNHQINQQFNQQFNQQINHINQYINTPIQIPVPATFVKHGYESVDHITKDFMLQLLNKRFDVMCSDLVKELYFNKKVPRNNNWSLAYPKDENAGLAFNYDTNLFERTSTKDLIDDKFSNMITLLQPLIEEILKEDEETQFLNNRQRYNISMYYGHFGMMQISKEDPALYEIIHQLAYNYKSIPMTNWHEHGLTGNHLSIKFG